MVRALAVIVGLVVATSSGAFAQNVGEAAKLFEEGRALAKDGKYVEACDTFAKSLQLDPAPGTKVNYADCHEHLGHNALAYHLFIDVYEADKTANPERSKFAKTRADALAPKLGTLVIKLAEPVDPTTSVTIAGRVVPAAAQIRELVDPGDVVVEVKTPSGAPFTRTAAAKAGATLVIDATSSTAGSNSGGGDGNVVGGGGGTNVGGSSDEPTARRHSRVLLAYGLGGVGVASLGTGVIVGIVARGQYQAQITNGNCTDASPPICKNQEGIDKQNHAISIANVGTVFGVVGLVAIASGAVVFLTAPRDLVVSPTVSAESAGITVVGRF